MSTENTNLPLEKVVDLPVKSLLPSAGEIVSAEEDAAEYSRKLMSAARIDASPELNFDLQMAWLRRLKSDVDTHFKAFALRLKEALPDHVTVQEKKPFLFGETKLTGVIVDMGEKRYLLEMVKGRLEPKVAMIVRGIALNTRHVDLAEWFAQVIAESQKATEDAKRLSESLSRFL
jgi:hypothetical protein